MPVTRSVTAKRDAALKAALRLSEKEVIDSTVSPKPELGNMSAVDGSMTAEKKFNILFPERSSHPPVITHKTKLRKKLNKRQSKIIVLRYAPNSALSETPGAVLRFAAVAENAYALLEKDIAQDEISLAPYTAESLATQKRKVEGKENEDVSPKRTKVTARHTQTVVIDGHAYGIKEESDDDYKSKSEIFESVLLGSDTRSKLRARGRSGRAVKTKTGVRKSTTNDLTISRATAVIKKREKQEIKKEILGSTSAALPVAIATKAVKRRSRLPKDFFTNKYNFKFDWTPYEDFNSPSDEVCHKVFSILQGHHAKENIIISLDPDALRAEVVQTGPMHAGEGITFDALVKTMMSQATNNTNALVAQHSLIQAFPYSVDGKRVVGSVPNYHDIRLAETAKLEKALRPAGLNVSRARAIKACLDIVYSENVARLGPGADIGSLPHGNPEGATDFVPGLLSLDYLKDLSKEELFDRLVSFPLIGVKTAACILAFNYKQPVFAVDTHVFRIAKQLKWLPDECNDRVMACAHLDFHVPEELKYGLHQAFWHHGQRCKRCMAKNNEKSKGWEEAVCPIEEFMTRFKVKERKVKVKNLEEKKNKPLGGADAVGNGGKAKTKKGNKTVLRMTAEEAAQRGYKQIEIPIDDNFGAERGNITGSTKFVWVKDADFEDGVGGVGEVVEVAGSEGKADAE